MRTKSELVKVEKVRGYWAVVGRKSGNIYYGGTRFDCCWKMSQPDFLAYSEGYEQETIDELASGLEDMRAQEAYLLSDDFQRDLEYERKENEAC